MRLTKTKIKKTEISQIESLSLKTGKFNDTSVCTDFNIDVYSTFLKGNQDIKTAWDVFEEVKQLFIKWKVSDFEKASLFHQNIKKFLENFVKSPQYRDLTKLPPMEALAVFLKLFPPQKTNNQEGTPSSGNFSSKDNFKNDFSESSIPIDLEKAEKMMKKTSEIEKAGIFEDEFTQKLMASMAQGDEHKKIDFSDKSAENIERISKILDQKQLEILKVARYKEFFNDHTFESDTVRSELPSDAFKINKMFSFSEIPYLLPTSLALEDDLFYLKLITKELFIKEQRRPQSKKQALYLLIDVSCSMMGSPSLYASAVGLMFIKQAIKNQATYFLRFFDVGVTELYKATNEQEALEVAKILLKQPFTGGGTSFDVAINTALRDIKKNPELFDKIDIMMITDGECYFSLKKSQFNKVKLHTTLIGTRKNLRLEKLSDSYEVLSVKEIEEDFQINFS